jgi:hypothetical protein
MIFIPGKIMAEGIISEEKIKDNALRAMNIYSQSKFSDNRDM